MAYVKFDRRVARQLVAAALCFVLIGCGGGSDSKQAAAPSGNNVSTVSVATAKTLSVAMPASTLATAAPVILGSAAEGSGTDTLTDSTGAYINASRFKAQSTSSITALYAKVGGISGGYRVAVYSDSGGQPGTLLSASVEVSPKTSGWVAFALTTAVPVQVDTYYWLAVWSNDTAATVSATPGAGVLRWGKYNYGSTWPTALNVSDGANLQYAIYAVGSTQQTVPTVALVSPAAGATFVAPASISITANVSDAGGIAKVEFFNGSTKLGESTTAPYGFNWSNVPAGPYTVRVVATGNDGLVSTASASINVSARAPISTGNVVMGSTGEGDTTDTLTDASGAYINASRQLAASSSTVSTIYARVGAISGSYRVAIYGDASGNPGSLLASSGDVSPKSTGWTSFALSTPLAISGGSAYWMAIWSNDTAARVFATTGSGAVRWGNYDYSKSWPATLSLDASGSTLQYSMYAVANADAVVPPESATVFSDDFNGSSLGSAWTVIQRRGPPVQDENECNTAGAVGVAGGILTIITSATPDTCGDAITSPTQLPYTTGDIQWTNLNFTYGTVEVRAKLPPQNSGTWPAMWLLGSNCQTANVVNGSESVAFMGCPAQGDAEYREIDFLECDKRGWCHMVVAQGTSGWSDLCTFPVDSNWHVFSLIWTASAVSMAVDGAPTGCSYPNTSLKGPMFLIFQTQTTTAAGVAGLPNNAKLPNTFQIDYVKVTQP